MSQELSARLAKIVEQKRLKEKLERDVQAVEKDLQDKSARLQSLSAQLAKESVDVEKLERMSLTALFYSVLGSREQQLEKERQEFLSAQLLHQQTKYQVESLQRDRESLRRQLSEVSGVEAEHQQLLSEKEKLLRQSSQAVAGELVQLAEQIANLDVEEKEIAEAIAAGSQVVSGLGQVIQSLESAENWGTWDIIGGGLISTAIKHSRIDDARSGAHDIQVKISQFKRELADVRQYAEFQIDIGDLDYFADIFFDGLIVDWIVQAKIVDSLERSKHAQNVIARAVQELETLKKNAQSKNQDLKESRARLIERS